jgi:hypothetical protein
MQLEDAITRIEKSLSRMNALYGRTVFNEIAVIALEGNQLQVGHYDGPRKDAFMANFADDSQAIRKELKLEASRQGGEFSFTREGDGSGVDAYICLGPDVYLFCNHTEKSMKEITEDASWLDAQGSFLGLSQFFAVDPLIL